MAYGDLDSFDYNINSSDMFWGDGLNKNALDWLGGRDSMLDDRSESIANSITPTVFKFSDRVNSPPHYTRGKAEAIEIIEDAIQDAPGVAEGMLQAQVLKYVLRLWLKDNSKEDAEKARWYLNRLIDKLS